MSREVSFPGTTAVVTGGASGIGKGLARAFRDAGCAVVIGDLDGDALAATAEELGVLGVPTDVGDPGSVAALAERAVAEHGEVHVVCANAGVGPVGAVADLTLEDWRWMLQVNLFGVVHTVHAFLPVLQRNPDWGHLVVTSSMSALCPPPGLGAYVAAKAGVLGLTEVLAAELAGSPVGTTVLLPGAVRTNIKDSLRTRPPGAPGALTDHDLAASGRPHRWLEPDEVAAAVVTAVRDGQPYVVTHPEWLPVAGQRLDRIAAGALHPA
ncbi:SDR family NAD(P)-dependent oxidoreductase [Modestobacter sp. NPDC049651]|uniref:SDR family oxidoreductase n=1 Tax=unclassified Modestobacter TaxID=2643866 RepID=UPI0033DB4853